MYQCSKCGSQHLMVNVVVSAHLIQDEGGDIETTTEGSHEWDGTSTMWCIDCGHTDGANSFFRSDEGVTPCK